MFVADLDIGERLYARNTVASMRKRSNTKNTLTLEAAWSDFSEQGIDVKAEVDRMFSSIMDSIEREPRLATQEVEVTSPRHDYEHHPTRMFQVLAWFLLVQSMAVLLY